MCGDGDDDPEDIHGDGSMIHYIYDDDYMMMTTSHTLYI